MEHELSNCDRIYLTSDEPWDPYSQDFVERERPFLPTNRHYEVDEYLHATYDFQGDQLIRATSSKDHRSNVSAAELARRWGTSLSVAGNTLKVTTQRGIRFITKDNLSRRFWTWQAQLGHKWLRTAVYSDTAFGPCKSTRGFECAQVFVTDQHYTKIYPMKSKSEAFTALNSFCHNVGIPNPLVTDNAGEETFGDWEEVRKKFLMEQRYTEPHSPWQNKAELEIWELRKHYRRIMHKKRVPEVLWCYCLEYVSEVRVFTAKHGQDQRTPYESLTGETPDISEYI